MTLSSATEQATRRPGRRVRGGPAPEAPARTHPAVLAVVAASVGAATVATLSRGLHPGALVAVAALVPAALVDARTGRLPNRLVAVAAGATAITVAAASVAGRDWSTGELVGGAAMLTVPLLVVHLVSPAAMGFGDVKAAVVLGAGLGLIRPELGLVALFAGSGLTAVAGLALRRRTVPFGPGLVVGAALAIAVAGSAIDAFEAAPTGTPGSTGAAAAGADVSPAEVDHGRA